MKSTFLVEIFNSGVILVLPRIRKVKPFKRNKKISKLAIKLLFPQNSILKISKNPLHPCHPRTILNYTNTLIQPRIRKLKPFKRNKKISKLAVKLIPP